MAESLRNGVTTKHLLMEVQFISTKILNQFCVFPQ